MVTCSNPECGQEIWFQKVSDATKPSGYRNVPMNSDGEPHKCGWTPLKAGKDMTDAVQMVDTGGFKVVAPTSEQQAQDWSERIQQANNTALSVVQQFGEMAKQYIETKAHMENSLGMALAAVDDLKSTWQEQLKSVTPIMVKTPSHEWVSAKRQHVNLPKLYRRVMQVRGRGIVFLVGEPGSMKTSVVDPLAEMLGIEESRRFVVSANNQMSRAELLGFNNGYGNFVETAIYWVVKNGGLLIIDEIDAGNANVLTALNTAATNEFVGFANGELVRKHPQCYIIAAGNTVGKGSTEEFVGRNQLDLATRTRFVFLRWDTDWDLVAEIVKAQLGTDEWAKKVKLLHDIVQRHSYPFVVSSRVALIGAAMLADDEDEMTVLEEMVKPNLSEDEWDATMRDYERMLEQVGMAAPVSMGEFSQEELKMLAKAYSILGAKALPQQLANIRPSWSETKCTQVARQIVAAKSLIPVAAEVGS